MKVSEVDKILEDTLKYFDKRRGGMLNRVSVIDFASEVSKRVHKFAKAHKEGK